MQSKSPHFLFVVVAVCLLLLTACGESATPFAGLTPPPTAGSEEASMLLGTATTGPQPTPTGLPPTSTPLPPVHVVILDPGHGADDWGTFHSDSQGQPDILEKDIVLQIARKIQAQMDPAAFKVILTRTADASPNFPPQDFNGDGKVDQVDDLQARINIANENKGDLFLSLHINSSELGNDVGGLETWYAGDRPFAAENKRFAEIVQQKNLDSLAAAGYNAQNRKVDDDANLDSSGEDIFVLGPDVGEHRGATNMPGVLTELLFLTNDHEAALLNDDKVQDKLAGGMAEAIKEYFAGP
jgi:N-acetylmuramoyl-L-alanine amidase